MPLTRVFVDESGDVGHTNKHLIGAVVISENHKEVVKIIRDTKRQFPRLKKAVLHAADDPPEAVRFLLNELQTNRQLGLSVGIFDQEKWWWNRKESNNNVYCSVIAETIRHSLSISRINLNQVEIVIERRFTNKNQNESFKNLISNNLDILPSRIKFETKNTKKGSGWSDHLSVADYLAWSYYQYYSKNDDQFVSIIGDNVKVNHLGIDGEGIVRLVSEERGGFL